MPDTKGYDTPFKDYVADKMTFQVVPTSGTEPAAKPVVATSAGLASSSVTPVELPINQLWFGKK